MERFLCPRLREDQKKKKKKGLQPELGRFFSARKVYCLSYYCNFMINNHMSVQQLVCAQSLKSVCARTA